MLSFVPSKLVLVTVLLLGSNLKRLVAQDFPGKTVKSISIRNHCNNVQYWTIEPSNSGVSISPSGAVTPSFDNGNELSFPCNSMNDNNNHHVVIKIPTSDLSSIDVRNQVTVQVLAGFTQLHQANVHNQATLLVNASSGNNGVVFIVSDQASGYLVGTVERGSSVSQEGDLYIQGGIKDLDVSDQSHVYVNGGTCQDAETANESSCQRVFTRLHMPWFNC